MKGWRALLLGPLTPASDQLSVASATHESSVTSPTSGVDELAAELQRIAPERAEIILSQLCAGLRSDTDENGRYRIAEALTATIYPKYKFSEYGRLCLDDEAFLAYYKRFMDVDNWHSFDRKYTLDQLLKLVVHLNGDFAECGAYKGASAYRMCELLRDSGRVVHLFDSFEGLSAPHPCDGDYWVAGALRASEQTLRATLAEFDNFHIYRGWIPSRFTEVAGRRFSFVHIDVDLYQPTLDSLNFFYERTETAGLILMDDYGFRSCPGAKRAADEFFAERPEGIVMLPTGQAFVIKR